MKDENPMSMRKQEPMPPRRAPSPPPPTSSSSSSSSASMRTPPAGSMPCARTGGDGDSCYFPGCRKDASCDCERCLASIRATRDLVPPAASARSFAAAKKPARPLFAPDTPPPSTSSTVTAPGTPPVRSTARSRRPAQPPAATAAGGKEGRRPTWVVFFASLGLLLLWLLDSGFLSEAAARGFSPKLTPEAVARLGEDARAVPSDLKHKLESLQQKIGQIVGGEKISDCSSQDSVWELKQGAYQLFYWRCVVYKTAAERVSVWGSPVRTSGLLPVMLSARSLTVLSGRITEWSDGRLEPAVRLSNCSSWSYRKRSSAAVRLEPETWVLEYERSVLFQGPRLMPAAFELIVSRASAMAERFRHSLRSRSARRRLPGRAASGIPVNPT